MDGAEIIGESWSDVNSLLSLLRDFRVVDLVEQEFGKYSNEAPAILLMDQIEKVRRDLKLGISRNG